MDNMGNVKMTYDTTIIDHSSWENCGNDLAQAVSYKIRYHIRRKIYSPIEEIMIILKGMVKDEL